MRSNDIIIDIPLDIPLSHQAPSAEDFKKYSGETRAALKASAALLKSTFQSVSKGFLDLADGAQSGMDKKLFEKEKAEAEFEKFADTMETMARHVGQKYFPATTPEDKKEEDAPNNSFFNMSSEKWTPTNEPKHIRKSKKKFSFKKAAERLNTNSVLAKMAKEETEKRTDESAAELRKKLSELNLKGVAE
uniref:Uncharacterized protein n=1 Tax=Caenorhabditis japonica TaxID=281687 RepID=A0A8R1EDJ1_CAEJA